MDIVLFTIALLILLLAGCGAALLLTRGRDASALEMMSLSLLCGSATVSLVSFWLGFLFSGSALRWTVTAVALALGAAAMATRRSKIVMWPIDRKRDWLFIGLLLIQFLIIAWVSVRLALGYDGLILWETKARLLFLNGGVMPIDYYRDSSKFFAPHYPLLLPLTEAWFYGWMGHRNQGLIKLVSPLFYLAAIGLLYAGAARLSGRSWRGFPPAALFFFVPCVVIRVSAGEADLPLGVFYLAAVVYLLEYWRTGEMGALRLVGAMAAIMPWVKQDGGILLLCVAGLAVIKAVERKQWKAIGYVALPAALIWGGWRALLKIVNVSITPEFLPVTPRTLWSNLDRIPVIAEFVAREMANWRTWGLLWFVPLIFLLRLKDREGRGIVAVSLIAVYLPVSLYAAIYLFSSWTPFTLHMEASFARLLLQLSLVAALMIGLAIPESIRDNRRGF
ncbi:MAG: glycosyltransferase family 39 protein [Blastocatellia bacterium]